MGLGFALSGVLPHPRPRDALHGRLLCQEQTNPMLQQKWNNIPEDIDLLMTHMPPHQILDSYVNKEMVR